MLAKCYYEHSLYVASLYYELHASYDYAIVKCSRRECVGLEGILVTKLHVISLLSIQMDLMAKARSGSD